MTRWTCTTASSTANPPATWWRPRGLCPGGQSGGRTRTWRRSILRRTAPTPTEGLGYWPMPQKKVSGIFFLVFGFGCNVGVCAEWKYNHAKYIHRTEMLFMWYKAVAIYNLFLGWPTDNKKFYTTDRGMHVFKLYLFKKRPNFNFVMVL